MPCLFSCKSKCWRVDSVWHSPISVILHFHFIKCIKLFVHSFKFFPIFICSLSNNLNTTDATTAKNFCE